MSVNQLNELGGGVVNETEPLQRDIDLHPWGSSDKTEVSQFELDSLYKIYQLNCYDLKSYKKEIELLRAQNNKLEAELHEEKNKNMMKERKLSQIQTKMEGMKSYFMADITAERSSHDDCNDQVLQSVEDVTSGLGLLLKKEQKEKEHLLKKCALLQKSLHSTDHMGRRHLENRLKQMEAMFDLLNQWNKQMENENWRLSRKLDILYGKYQNDYEADWTVEVKKLGRFEVMTTLKECHRCHQTFHSTEEMQQSICHYHPAALPVSNGTGYFWPCCYTDKDSVGCRHGDHVLTNKRQRTEE